MTREEALQNIKKFIGTSDTLDESIFTLCPELEESKDERIRKELVDMINECTNWIHKKEYVKYLEKQKEQKTEAKLTGWVARDSEHNPYFGLGLFLFKEKPRRSGDCWCGTIASRLPWDLFPDLKWEDGPVEVEITIKRK